MVEIGVDDGEYGVLLYYNYASIPDIDQLFNFYESSCGSLDLLGRVRLAPQGVNVTVGGKLSALKRHIEEVKSNSLFKGTDFKLASCHHPANDKVAKECGFTSLSIRIVKELVTLTSHPLLNPPDVSNAGKHLSAHEFHSVLHNAVESSEAESPDLQKEIVLLDARNLYETRIGKFDTPNVETVDPEIRQYSDLPTWIDQNCEKLKGRHVLMYCTGGIRCEMASAYIKSKGAGFENVYQLYGGIQRYLEQFPDGLLLGAQTTSSWGHAFYAVVRMMTILLGADVLTVECSSWFVKSVRHFAKLHSPRHGGTAKEAKSFMLAWVSAKCIRL
ncbi:unnamed protein product [Rhodiola kirilowii]